MAPLIQVPTPTTTAAQTRTLKGTVLGLVPAVEDVGNRNFDGGAHPLPARRPAPPLAGDEPTEIVKQPKSRPVSQKRLLAEVKGIYTGLVMVEKKCIEVVNDRRGNRLSNAQWQALIHLHCFLLEEYYDFFLASQHPSASPAVRSLPSRHGMIARMWQHGVQNFLDLLRYHLPASLEYMLTFIYKACSMMALLYETVPVFEDTWIECLGKLTCYRIAIEGDIRVEGSNNRQA
ncbi:hypothetical protein C8A03DRAFT_33810 [Achaetomium macrosporum]|uniref:DNA/RNA-binding domain-containing protein n=1 Tax=Achaetomium macrosporum TaxID=79813 RepID=A0AAN7HFF4_9PEZI|nr:hypothetical protein C8A03DRAFT_33810 [Achaetomium macrosporum]